MTTQIIKVDLYLRLITFIFIHNSYTPNLPVICLNNNINILSIKFTFKHSVSPRHAGKPFVFEFTYHLCFCAINRYSKKTCHTRDFLPI